MLRLEALWIEFQTDLDVRGRFFTDRMEVQVEVDLRPRLHAAGGAFRKHIPVLAERVFVQQGSSRIGDGHWLGTFRLNEVRDDMMDDSRAPGGFCLHRHQPAIFGEPRVHDEVRHWSGALAATTTSLGRVTMRSGLPMCQRPMSSNFGLGGMSAGVPCGAPLSAHRTIVRISFSVSDGSSLKRGNAHVAVDVPRRHLASRDLLANRPSPRARFFVAGQGHGADRPRPMAVHARFHGGSARHLS